VMTKVEDMVSALISRLKQRGYAQVTGYNRFGFVRQADNYVVVSRENGKDTKIPYSKLAVAIEAVQKDSKVYSEGPSRLRKHGLTHITSPLWSLLHLLTLEELTACMLPDLLEYNLRIVFCGTAAGKKSAQLQMYYAGQGNKFWRVLKEVGLTPELLSPHQYTDLLNYRIGLTDLVKYRSGMDHQIDFKNKGSRALHSKIQKFKPVILCFNGKRAAEEFLSHTVSYSAQQEQISLTRLFVAPSTSGAANGFWDTSWWYELERMSR